MALAREFRTQRIIFETARDVFDQMKLEIHNPLFFIGAPGRI